MDKYFIFVIATVLLNAASQILLKSGTNTLGKVDFASNNLVSILVSAAFNPYIIFGLVLMTISMLTYLLALTRYDVSFAFPFISVAYVLVAVYGSLYLSEPLSSTKILGIGIILCGTVVMSFSQT